MIRTVKVTVSTVGYTELIDFETAGQISAVTVSPSGSDVYLSFDGTTDSAILVAGTGAAGFDSRRNTFRRVWGKIAGGSADVIISCESGSS